MVSAYLIPKIERKIFEKYVVEKPFFKKKKKGQLNQKENLEEHYVGISDQNKHTESKEERKGKTPEEEFNQIPSGGTFVTDLIEENEFSVSLGTIPVYLINKGNRLRVNLLLDDARTNSFINKNVADKLGLVGETKEMKIRVLNVTKSVKAVRVNVELQSTNGSLRQRLSLLVVYDVTGDLKVCDWEKIKCK